MFRAIIAKRAWVPAGDSFIVRRVAGPGLASNFFYQIKTEQALVALEARMEVAEVEAYKVCKFTMRFRAISQVSLCSIQIDHMINQVKEMSILLVTFFYHHYRTADSPKNSYPQTVS